MTTVLIVDDELPLVDILIALFGNAYRVVMATTGQAALYQLQAEAPDLILLDLCLPDVDGQIVLHQLRRQSDVPIIVLSGRDEQPARVASLHAGADDFIAKPFDIDDLEARMQLVLRRSRPPEPVAPPPPPDIPRLGLLSISHKRGAFFDNRAFHVTPVEFRLLHTLLLHPGQPVTRQDLATPVWGASDAGTTRSMDTHLGRLRQRLALLPDGPTIVSVKNVGYQIEARKAS